MQNCKYMHVFCGLSYKLFVKPRPTWHMGFARWHSSSVCLFVRSYTQKRVFWNGINLQVILHGPIKELIFSWTPPTTLSSSFMLKFVVMGLCLRRDAIHKRGPCRYAVSICLSVDIWHAEFYAHGRLLAICLELFEYRKVVANHITLSIALRCFWLNSHTSFQVSGYRNPWKRMRTLIVHGTDKKLVPKRWQSLTMFF